MDKSTSRIRWIILLLSCILMIGNYYCFDNPASLKTQLQQRFHFYTKDRFEFLFNLLYTLYSIPNIILPLFSGILVDRLGARAMLLLFSIVIVFGQCLFALGCSFRSFPLMLFGRVIFGLGGESLGVAQGALIASWFQYGELALALGINLSVARLGSVINNKLSPLFSAAMGLSSALWIGVSICCMSLAATAIVMVIDRGMDTKQSISRKVQRKSKKVSIRKDLRQFRPHFWLLAFSCLVVYGCVIPFNNVASSLLLERDYYKRPSRYCVRCGEGAYAMQRICNEIAYQCPLSPPYAWPLPNLSANCTIHDPEDQWFCSHSEPYLQEYQINCDDIAWKSGPFTKLYCQKKEAATKKAATPMSVPYLLSSILSPAFGIIVDYLGLRAVLALIAPVTLLFAHFMLGFTSVNVYLPLLLQGLAYSVFAAALWPSVPYVVDPEFVGSAYGVITSIQNAGLAAFPLFVAAAYERHEAYIPTVEVFFIILAALGTIIGIALNVFDCRNGAILNSAYAPNAEKQMKHLETILEQEETLLSSSDGDSAT